MSWTDRVQESILQAGVYTLRTVERLQTGIAYTPNTPSFHADPYPLYHELQQCDPLHRSYADFGWVVSRYQTIETVLRDQRFSADDRKGRPWKTIHKMMLQAGRLEKDEEFVPSMLRLDPPDHTRLRKLVSKVFTPRAIQALRPQIENVVAQLLAAVQDADTIDIIRDVANPLPIIVIAEMLGIPHADREQFKRWSDEAIRELDIASIDDLRRSGQAIKELNAYFSDIIEQRRHQPQDDLLSALILAEEEGDTLTVEEIYATCELLLIAGHETTTNLIGNGMLALLRNPEQLTLLRNAPDLMPNAIEELLRYDSPVQITSRYALEDCELDGQAIKKGQQLVLLLGAANRDPAVYEQPGRLDITRQDSKHLSFSIGIHFCLGAALARLEGQIAVSALLRRFPGLRLASDSVQWRDSATLRGLTALPVVI